VGTVAGAVRSAGPARVAYLPGMAGPDLHPSLAPLAFLLGDWEGEGEGDYPTIDAFTYRERLTFSHGGRPFLTYLQLTEGPGGDPMHTETGYLRVAGPASGGGHAVEMVLAQPTGVAEVLTGLAVDHDVHLHSTRVALTPTAKRVDTTARRLRLHGGRLVVDLSMAAVGEPLTHHLHSELVPVA